MKTFFADTFFFLAALNPDDLAHPKAIAAYRQPSCAFLTTAWMIIELADALAAQKTRAAFVRFLEHLRRNPNIKVLPFDEDLSERGLQLYAQRPDKDWSLTDCISFVAMKEHNLNEALTGDHHFEQAGFKALLK